MYQCLIGVHHLFQVDGFVAIVGEGGIGIELLVGFDDIFHGCRCLDDSSTEDSTGEVTTIGDEVDVGIEVALYLFQTLTDLRDVLRFRWAAGNRATWMQVAKQPGLATC